MLLVEAVVGGIRVPGSVCFSYQGKVVQGLAACGIHVFVAVSIGVLCDMWHVSTGYGRHRIS